MEMFPTQKKKQDSDHPAGAILIQPSSPRFLLPSTCTPTSGGAHRRIGVAIDLSDESAHAVKWAVQNYLRPGDAVILVHVTPTSVLYGADWGSPEETRQNQIQNQNEQQRIEDRFDTMMKTKSSEIAQPLVAARIPFKIHVVKDHDMKERLCLEVERLGLSAVVMGSRGFGAAKRSGNGRLGSVSDYCVHHCVCPVVVVRFPEERDLGKEEVTKGVDLLQLPSSHMEDGD